jgi:hypothetical protein
VGWSGALLLLLLGHSGELLDEAADHPRSLPDIIVPYLLKDIGSARRPARLAGIDAIIQGIGIRDYLIEFRLFPQGGLFDGRLDVIEDTHPVVVDVIDSVRCPCLKGGSDRSLEGRSLQNSWALGGVFLPALPPGKVVVSAN